MSHDKYPYIRPLFERGAPTPTRLSLDDITNNSTYDWCSNSGESVIAQSKLTVLDFPDLLNSASPKQHNVSFPQHQLSYVPWSRAHSTHRTALARLHKVHWTSAPPHITRIHSDTIIHHFEHLNADDQSMLPSMPDNILSSLLQPYHIATERRLVDQCLHSPSLASHTSEQCVWFVRCLML